MISKSNKRTRKIDDDALRTAVAGSIPKGSERVKKGGRGADHNAAQSNAGALTIVPCSARYQLSLNLFGLWEAVYRGESCRGLGFL
jgi:hypothetical protein